jgi:cell division protease FtsH
VNPNIDLEVVAKGTPGFTGADLANLVNEAALLAARAGKKVLDLIDFEAAKDKVLMGVERKSMIISEKEKRITAYHEAGHTLVGMNLPHTDPIHKVSIIPRGGALGVTQTLPSEEMLNLSTERANNFIAFLLGGRCAEEIMFNEKTNGASNDIERATQLARSMVCDWGMSEKLGPINFAKGGDKGYYPSSDALSYSQETAERIDHEITSIISKNHEIALKILNEKRDQLVRIAEGLMLWETLDQTQISDLVAGKDIGAPLATKKTPAADSTSTTPKFDTTKPALA